MYTIYDFAYYLKILVTEIVVLTIYKARSKISDYYLFIYLFLAVRIMVSAWGTAYFFPRKF